VVTFRVDEELQGRIQVAIRFADGTDVIGGVNVDGLRSPVAQHRCGWIGTRSWWGCDLGVRLDEAVDFDWLKFWGWRGFQSLVFENIPPPTFSGTEERWQTKVWLESSIVSYVIGIVFHLYTDFLRLTASCNH
jgi:hypothetical protein